MNKNNNFEIELLAKLTVNNRIIYCPIGYVHLFLHHGKSKHLYHQIDLNHQAHSLTHDCEQHLITHTIHEHVHYQLVL